MPALRQRPGKAAPQSKRRSSGAGDGAHESFSGSSGKGKNASSSSDGGMEVTEAVVVEVVNPKREKSDRMRAISILDIFRLIFLLLLTSSALSYFITSDSFFWGYRPWFTRWPVVKRYIHGPINLTPVQLALYNGSDPTLPIYVAINGTIFDVSANPRIYGAGGGYNSLAGVDATRAFATGCFKEDRTPDLRGVELMFIPIDDDDGNPAEQAMSGAEKKIRREKELRAAREMVRKQVSHWKEFFENHKDYFEVGRVLGGPGVEGKGLEKRELCEQAQKRRPKRSVLNENAAGGDGS
ncbi:hypothetical protein PAAG_08539 [Paracoccidioides lutzii Pb01]|uniref:Cytochrome b5 heme-binding domain-containing protein n=1 Tax=Paracoccidioides lutzii (strain ATCC MYA-826 / Pb01) TaxID=502779 RepID=C1HCP8_PARBA|nr:hypothetical protein PAAG_08539 [Paracoccidioides lutzii Pb01]EEH38812.1 hypothetical protein PAAG_08539 [Paracoccidioides lutzii Pb01]